MSNSFSNQTFPKIKVLIYSILFTLFIWTANFFIVSFLTDDLDREILGKYGTFGDMFGAVNALFSGLAFSVIAYSIFQQNEQIRLQRLELSLQKEELKRTADELAGQKNLMNIQNFDSKFFHLIELHERVVHNIRYEKMLESNQNWCIESCEARSFIKKFVDKLELEIQTHANDFKQVFNKEIYPNYQNQLNHYFRNIQLIIHTIDNEHAIKNNIEKKKEAIQILQAQLSSEELIIIGFYGFTKHGMELGLLIEKYRVLSTLDENAFPEIGNFLKMHYSHI
jgi:hypothetical protein